MDRFAEAIAELPLGNLHAKAAELRNSIAHLVSSNQQLQQYAENGDKDCADAVLENNEVIGRMEMRISLLKSEVKNRGFRWSEDEPATVNGKTAHPTNHNEANHSSASESTFNAQPPRGYSGSLNDEELARQLNDQLNEEMQDDDDGVHL